MTAIARHVENPGNARQGALRKASSVDPERVNDPASFLAFARALAADRAASVASEKMASRSPRRPEAGGWENTTIGSFLEGASDWAESTNFGVTQGLSPDNPWRQFAVFLYCGKIYE